MIEKTFLNCQLTSGTGPSYCLTGACYRNLPCRWRSRSSPKSIGGPRASAITSDRAARVGGALYGASFVKGFWSCWNASLSLAECRRRAPTLCRATPIGSADGSSPTAAQRCAEGAGLCVGHVRQFGGESPLCNLMEVKH